jgi:hypothetical protein
MVMVMAMVMAMAMAMAMAMVTAMVMDRLIMGKRSLKRSDSPFLRKRNRFC